MKVPANAYISSVMSPVNPILCASLPCFMGFIPHRTKEDGEKGVRRADGFYLASPAFLLVKGCPYQGLQPVLAD